MQLQMQGSSSSGAAAAGGFALGLGAGLVLAGLVVRRERRERQQRRAAMRVGGSCRLRPGPEALAAYTRLHDHTWDEVMARMYAVGMRNFSVHLDEERLLMFSYFEFVRPPADLDGAMAQLARDPVIRQWWSHCEPCQEPYLWSGPAPSLGGTGYGARDAWWAGLRCLKHCGAWPVEYGSQWPDPDFESNNPAGETSTLATP